MKINRIGSRRLCAALVLCALLLNFVPVAGLTAFATMSYDPNVDSWIELYTIDENGKRTYIDHPFPANNSTYDLSGMFYIMTDTIWNDRYKPVYDHYTSLSYPQFETVDINYEVQHYLNAGITEDEGGYRFFSRGDYKSLLEDPNTVNYLEWNPLFTLNYTFSYTEYHYSEWTYEELCDRTVKEPFETTGPGSTIVNLLDDSGYNGNYSLLFAEEGWANENGYTITYGGIEERPDKIYYGRRHYIPRNRCPWDLKDMGYTLDEMFQYYHNLYPDILFLHIEDYTTYDLRFSYPVYAKINSKTKSRYMFVDLDGGRAYSNGKLYADGNCVFQGVWGEAIEYPEELTFRKPGYVLDGWEVMIAGEGAQDTMRIANSLDATMGEYSTQWKATWQEVPVSGFTLHYDRNAEDALGDDMPNDFINWGEYKTLRYPTYYYPHHRFVKWTQYPDGTGHWCPVKDHGKWEEEVTTEHLHLDDIGSEDVTLYAQWTDQGDASFTLDARKGYYDKYSIEDFYAIECYTGEKREPSSNIYNVFTAFSGDAVTIKFKPYSCYKLYGLHFETEHSGTQEYILGANNTIQSNDGLYDDLAVEKGADGSYTFTFTMKNDHIFSIEPKLLFAPNGSYVDEYGVTRNCIEEGATPVTFSPNDAEWRTGWYIVDGNCTLVTRPAVKGDVKLILCDGATLTAPRGIVVCGDNTLSIYGQSRGTGKLIATGQEKCDFYYETEGRGDIDVGDFRSTAIGLAGPAEEKFVNNGGTINIYGGDITAVGSRTKEGIGVGSTGRIAIYGGTIHASSIREGNDHAPGIMAHFRDVYFAPGVCVIGHDGTIATADRRAVVAGDYDHDAVVCPCEHDDGYQTADGCAYCGASIYRALTLVQSEGGVISADAGSAPEGYGQIGEDVALTFTPDEGHHVESVTITYDDGTSITDAPEDDAYSFAMPKSPVTVAAEWARNEYTVSFNANGGSGSTDAVSGLYEDAVILPVSGFTAPDDRTFFSWCTNADGSGSKYSAGQAFTITEDTTLYAQWSEGLYYVDENGAPTVPDGSCSEINGESVDWSEDLAKYYVATGDVTIDDRVHVSGDVGLILCDGAELTVSEGITVPKGGSLAIYSQNADTGELICESNVSAAAIGGEEGQDCGKITICGGVVTATGGYYAAGIGSGECAEYEEISILGGTVTASSEGGGAGIGGGSWTSCEDIYSSNNGKIIIDGKRKCTVNAYGGDDGSAGIGGGYGQAAGTIDISNATVNAVGGTFGTGIGSGLYADESAMYEDAGTIRIHSGNITASARYGSGIGCGLYAPDFGTIEISGGTVIATGSAGEEAAGEGCGAGIGGNVGTSGGTVIITGGTITATGGCEEWYGLFGPGIGASEASVSISGPARITATGGKTWGIDGTIAISAPAIIRGSVNESQLTRDRIFSLKYDSSGAEGEAPAPVYAPSGTELTAAEHGDLAYGESIFSGWNTDENGSGAAYAENEALILNTDAILYAQWKRVYGIAMAETSNGTVTAQVDGAAVTAARTGATVALAVVPAEGYVLDTLTYTPEGGDAVDIAQALSFTMPEANVAVTATFRQAFTVAFAAGSDNATGTMDPVTVYGGAAYALPACGFTALDGKSFREWSVVIGAAAAVAMAPGSEITVTADTIVTAVWSNVYTVHFEPGIANVNGGMKDLTIMDGNIYLLPACDYTAEGSVFKEWSVKTGENEPVSKQPNRPIKVTADTIVTAVWQAIAFGTPDLVLPESTEVIEACAFEGVAATVVSVPSGCSSIGDGAFSDCPNLTMISIPAECRLGTGVFAGCTKVYIFGAAGSDAERYCDENENCVFVEVIGDG